MDNLTDLDLELDDLWIDAIPENPYDICPCGCGIYAGIRIRDDGTSDHYAWTWDRNEEKPTCTPSILINDNHWHGYLTEGVFRSV